MSYINVHFNGLFQEQVELNDTITTIGRSEDNDIQIDNPGVSTHHARILKEGEAFFIEDGDSKNGTNVNGEPVSRTKLNYGDMISILKHTLKFTPLSLQKETGNSLKAGNTVWDQAAGTIDIDASTLDQLLKQQIPSGRGYLMVQDSDGRHRKRPLDRPTYTMGKDPLSDLVVRGWFVPKKIASVDRRVDGYYLVPGKRGQVLLNGSRVRREVKLASGDELVIRRTAIQFVVDQP